MLALPIFPGRLQPSILGASELNFRVRDGNGWTLAAISTNLLFLLKKSKQKKGSFFSLPLFKSNKIIFYFLPPVKPRKEMVTRRRIELLFAA